jgi:hypothetical protein
MPLHQEQREIANSILHFLLQILNSVFPVVLMRTCSEPPPAAGLSWGSPAAPVPRFPFLIAGRSTPSSGISNSRYRILPTEGGPPVEMLRGEAKSGNLKEVRSAIYRVN